MTFEEIRSAVRSMSHYDQKRLVTELVPEIWDSACSDETCFESLRPLVDEAAVKEYTEQRMGEI